MNSVEKKQLLGLDLNQMEEFLLCLEEPRFRGRQVYKWIYQKECSSFYEMSDLPRSLRKKLDEKARVSIPRVLKQRVGKDGSRKFLMELDDKKKIECVLLPQSRDKKSSYTLCLSTQVGCPIACSFCATGQSGFQRNLRAFEIIGQYLGSKKELNKRLKSPRAELISNIVYMGMGEPLLNYDEVIRSVHMLNDPRGINLGQRRITISTSGEVVGINKLAQENIQLTLAISLHACDNTLRDQLIPLNRKYPLEVLFPAIEDYIAITGRRVTFEYLLLDEVNMSRNDANKMVKLLKPLLANVNLIPYNEIEGLPFKKPEAAKIWQFYQWLQDGGLNVSIREERGSDINAACGQLRSDYRR